MNDLDRAILEERVCRSELTLVSGFGGALMAVFLFMGMDHYEGWFERGLLIVGLGVLYWFFTKDWRERHEKAADRLTRLQD